MVHVVLIPPPRAR